MPATTKRPRSYKMPKTPPSPHSSKRTNPQRFPAHALTTYHHRPPSPDPRTVIAGIDTHSAATAAVCRLQPRQLRVDNERQHRSAYRVHRRCRRDCGCCGDCRAKKRYGCGHRGRHGRGCRSGRRRCREWCLEGRRGGFEAGSLGLVGVAAAGDLS